MDTPVLRDLQRIANSNPMIDPDDLRRAAAVLIDRQFLYGDKSRDRSYFMTIIDNEEYFHRLYDALNLEMVVDRTASFVGVVPRYDQLLKKLDTVHTLMLLCLRLIYETAVKECRIGENAQVFTDSNHLTEVYEAHTRREKPMLGQMKTVLTTFRQQSIITRDDEEERVVRFRIRPAIRHIMTAEYMTVLEEYLKDPEAGRQIDDSSQEEPTEESEEVE